MLAIRMQRTGRKGHAQFRVVVQDSRQTPSSGRVIFNLGTYNPHTKEAKIDKEKASFYLTNGAQPSPRVSVLLKNQGVKLPSWATVPAKKQSVTKNSEKLRKNQTAKVSNDESNANSEQPNEEVKVETTDSSPVDSSENPENKE